jgi:hypothetical protein
LKAAGEEDTFCGMWHTFVQTYRYGFVCVWVGLYTSCRTKHWPLSQIDKWKERSKHHT